jgi:hypothetical protein
MSIPISPAIDDLRNLILRSIEYRRLVDAFEADAGPCSKIIITIDVQAHWAAVVMEGKEG